jgi:UDP-N-acetylmuramate dehydrogenase
MNLGQLTTLRVGGNAEHVLEPTTPDELVNVVRETWATGDDVLLLGGGSNVVIGDDGFEGTVIRVLTRGIQRVAAPGPGVRIRVQAGEPWDAVVAHAVANGWSGVEALSGIPGSSGAAPIQNIGAYGQEISSSLVSVDFLDYLTGERTTVPARELGLGYRSSALKNGREGLVVSIELELEEGGVGVGAALSAPIGYAQLATALGVQLGDRVPIETLRETVLSLRASKGMLWNDAAPDILSAGSFFTNPIVSENFARGLPAAVPRWPTAPEIPAVAVPLGEQPASPPRASAADYRVKLSAAWLIEHAGMGRGFSLPGSQAAVSSKHTLAIVNRGDATADEILQLARFIQTRVFAEFGVRLQVEPILVNAEL